MKKKIRAMYFTGTGTTEKITKAIASEIYAQLAEAQMNFKSDFQQEQNEAHIKENCKAQHAENPADNPAAGNCDDSGYEAQQAERTADAHIAAKCDIAGDCADFAADISFAKEPDIDFSPKPARDREYAFGADDIVVFGVPVIAGRVPNVLLKFLDTLRGGGAMAIPVVLYGNRNFDDALIELRNILEEKDFRTIAAAAFIGEHSFSRTLAAGRPDAEDMQIAADFAKDAADKILWLIRESEGDEAELTAILEQASPVEVEGCEPVRPYYKPQDRFGEHINILKVKPKLDEAKCSKCGICAEICPMGSISKETPGIVSGICIKCCGCVKKCPDEALYFDDAGYLYHKEELEAMYAARKEPSLFL